MLAGCNPSQTPLLIQRSTSLASSGITPFRSQCLRDTAWGCQHFLPSKGFSNETESYCVYPSVWFYWVHFFLKVCCSSPVASPCVFSCYWRGYKKTRWERNTVSKQPEFHFVSHTGVRIAVKSNRLCERGFKNVALMARGGSCLTISAVVIGQKQEHSVSLGSFWKYRHNNIIQLGSNVPLAHDLLVAYTTYRAALWQ